MNRKIYYVFGTLMLLFFGGFSFMAFQDAFNPYVSFAEARELDRAVQVAGGLGPGSSSYDDTSQALLFTLVDPENAEETLRVRYHGVKPANFEEAISIVAIGRFDPAADELTAEKLLVKCPSKYQGIEGDGQGTAGDGYETKSYG